ncbi:MAG TPA: hypothetical protein HPP77_06650 [Candidatus Hydrogenedentes bacterium]|nr:hypothetical protein [Candidatus Hydrogenedentota bacterium]
MKSERTMGILMLLALAVSAYMGAAACPAAQPEAAACQTAPGLSATQQADRPIVARVGDKVIFLDRFEDVVAHRIERLKGIVYTPEDVETQRQKLLEYMIDGKVMAILAERAGMEVSDAEVEEAVKKAEAEYGRGPRLEEHLRQIGSVPAEYPQFVREIIMIQKWLKGIGEGVVVTGDDIAEEYDKLKAAGVLTMPSRARVRHVFIRANKDDAEKWAEAKERIDQARARIRAGEDFAEVAEAVSEDPLTKHKGGLMENVMKNQMQPAFDKAVFELPIGEISEPVATSEGWHVLNVLERHDPEPVPLQAATDTIRKSIIERERHARMRKQIEEARATLKIETFLPPFTATDAGHPVDAPPKPEAQDTEPGESD